MAKDICKKFLDKADFLEEQAEFLRESATRRQCYKSEQYQSDMQRRILLNNQFDFETPYYWNNPVIKSKEFGGSGFQGHYEKIIKEFASRGCDLFQRILDLNNSEEFLSNFNDAFSIYEYINEEILEKIVLRRMTEKEYLSYLHGGKPIANVPLRKEVYLRKSGGFYIKQFLLKKTTSKSRKGH